MFFFDVSHNDHTITTHLCFDISPFCSGRRRWNRCLPCNRPSRPRASTCCGRIANCRNFKPRTRFIGKWCCLPRCQWRAWWSRCCFGTVMRNAEALDWRANVVLVVSTKSKSICTNVAAKDHAPGQHDRILGIRPKTRWCVALLFCCTCCTPPC